MAKTVLIVFASLACLIYLWMWVDFLYYKYEMRRVFRNVFNAFTEEE